MTMKLSVGIGSILLTSILAAGCAKKVAVVQPPTPPVQAAAPAQAAPARPAVTQQTPSRSQAPVQRAVSRTPDAATRARIQDLLNRIQDAYFDYNEHNLRPDAESALRSDAQTLALILKDYPDYKLTVEGYCDERGSEAYNLALGEERAQRARSFLTDSGIPGAQVKTVSYGKDRPVCSDKNESCWQKNRRAHITQAQ